jgi:N-acetylmuramoyl-L-alanine amidase
MTIESPWRSALARLLVTMACLLAPVQQASAQCTPETPLRVAIDVGHSPAAPGARSSTGKVEYAFNRTFALELVVQAASYGGLSLRIINPDGETISLPERTRRAAASDSDLFLSIHHDSAQPKYIQRKVVDGKTVEIADDDIKGYSLFVYRQTAAFARSLALARLIGKGFKAAGRPVALHHAEKIAGENRPLLDADLGVYDAPFAVLRTARMPAVLIEVGVIPNPAEEQFVSLRGNRAAMQRAILEALVEFCRQ